MCKQSQTRVVVHLGLLGKFRFPQHHLDIHLLAGATWGLPEICLEFARCPREVHFVLFADFPAQGGV